MYTVTTWIKRTVQLYLHKSTFLYGYTLYALGNVSSQNKLRSGLYCSDIVISNSVDSYLSILHPNDVKVETIDAKTIY